MADPIRILTVDFTIQAQQEVPQAFARDLAEKLMREVLLLGARIQKEYLQDSVEHVLLTTGVKLELPGHEFNLRK